MRPKLTAMMAAAVGLVVVVAWGGAASGPATQGAGTVYYVDFAGGADTADGLTPQTAFKHAPGDRAAAGKAKAAALAPGDTVLFKGGVLYRGTVAIASSGREGKPLVYNGNTAGTFGTGRAIIDGSEDLTDWKQCASADECGGNPNWKNIYWADAPKGVGLFTINLCEGNVSLAIAQDPNPTDPFFEDVITTFRPVADPPPAAISGVRITAGKGMAENPTRKYVLLVDGKAGTSAILDPLVGAELTFRPAQPATIASVGIAIADPKYYAPPKEVAFLADGKEVLRVTVEANQGVQKFPLPAAVAMKDLTLKVLSAQGENKQGYSALASLEAYDAAGKNVLLGPPLTVYRDANYFTQKDERVWPGAYFVIHAKPNVNYYQKVLSFDPRTGTITMEMLTAEQYPVKDTRFSMINSLAVLDRPGEFVVEETPRADGTRRVYLWPLDGRDGPKGIACSALGTGFTVGAVSHVTIEGFRIQKQGRTDRAFAISGGQGASDLLIRDNEITLIRSARSQVVGLNGVKRATITGNFIHENRRAGAIALDGSEDCVVADNILHKNGATCLLLYRSRNIRVERNVLTDHKGMHANGLTAYVNCRGISFIGNRVSGGNNALTLQEGEDMLVANNLFDGGHFASPVGLWGVGTLKNIRFYNNLFLRTDPKSDWALAVYCGGKGDMVGYVFRNNVIDGMYREGDIVAERDHNVYTRPSVSGLKENNWKMGPAEILEPDLRKLFVDPDKGDWRPKPGGPLDGTGVDVGLREDITGAKAPQGKAPSIGAYQK